MDEVSQRLEEYQAAVQKRDDYISRLSSSLQSTIQQRDELRQSAQQEAHNLAQQITVLKEQLQQTSAFLRNKEFSGINAAEFIALKNQLIAVNASNNSQCDVISSLKIELEVKAKALASAEALTARLQSSQRQENEELKRVRSELETTRRRQQQQQGELETLQRLMEQSRLEKSALEESFSKERTLLTNRLEQYSSQLSEYSLLDESLSVTQGRVSELTSQLEAAAHQLHAVTDSAARTETELRHKIRSLEEQLADRAPIAGQLQQQLEERFGQQLSQITGELRSSQMAELESLKQRHLEALSDLRAGYDTQVRDLSAGHISAMEELRTQHQAELAGLRRCREQQQVLVDSLKAQLAETADGQQEQLHNYREQEQQARVAIEARDALTQQLRVVTDEKNTLKEQLQASAEEGRTLKEQLQARTEEINALKEQMQAGTEERDVLREQLQLVGQVRNDTGSQLMEANQQRDQLCRALSATNQQREEITRQLTAANQEREELAHQLIAANEQREELTRQLTAISQERDDIAGQLAVANKQREEASHQPTMADRLRGELEALAGCREAASQQLQDGDRRLEEALQQRSSVSEHRDHLSQQLAASDQQQAEAAQYRDAAHKECTTAAQQQMQELVKQRDILEQEAREAKQQRDLLEQKAVKMTQHGNTLEQEREQALEQRDRVSQLLMEAVQLRDGVEKQLHKSETERKEVDDRLREVRHEREYLNQRLLETDEQNDILKQKLQGISQELKRAMQDRDNLAQQLSDLSQQLLEMTAQRDALSERLSAASQQASDTNDVVQQWSVELERHATAAAQLQAERSTLLQTLETARAECDRLQEALASSGSDRDRLQEALEGERQRCEAADAELRGRIAESESSAAQLRRELASAEDARRQSEAELAAQRSQSDTATAILHSRLSAAELARDQAQAELSARNAELAELTSREAALLGDRAATRDVSNTAIKMRARSETLARRLEDAERRVGDLERERAMLQETHQRYIGETTAQLAGSEAEVEKLRTCLLVQNLTSPRKEGKTVMSPRKGVMSPKLVVPLPENEIDDLSLLMREMDMLGSPQKEVLRTAKSGKEVRTVSSPRGVRAAPSEEAVVQSTDRLCLTSPPSQRSAADSGLTAGSGELSEPQLFQLESLMPTTATGSAAGGGSGRGQDNTAAAGAHSADSEVPQCVAVTRVLRRLCARLAVAERDRQLLQRQLRRRDAATAESAGQRAAVGPSDGGAGTVTACLQSGGVSPAGSPVRTARTDLPSSPSTSLGLIHTDRTHATYSPEPSAPLTAADCALEAADAVQAALTASELQQAQLLQLEARVSAELTELQLGLKAAVDQSANASAAIVLIDASYEVRLLKSKLAACGSVSMMLHEQLRQQRRVIAGFRQLFARLVEDWRLSDTEQNGSDSPLVNCSPSARLPSATDRDSSTPVMGSSAGRPLTEATSPAGTQLRDAELSEPWLTEPQLLQMLSAHSDAVESSQAEVSELRPAPSRPGGGGALQVDTSAHTPEVPPFDLRLLGELCSGGADWPQEAVVDPVGAEQMLPDEAERAADTESRHGVARSENERQNRTTTGNTDVRGEARVECVTEPTSAIGGEDRDGGASQGEVTVRDDLPEEMLMGDVELLETLVRENGTLRRALLFEKARSQRLLSAEAEYKECSERAEMALAAADQRQARLLDCVQHQQDAITRLQRAIQEGASCPAVPDLSAILQECRDSLRARKADAERPGETAGQTEEAAPHRLQELEGALTKWKLELDEANQLLRVRHLELQRQGAAVQSLSGDCDRLRLTNRDLANRLRRSAGALQRLRALRRGSELRCGRLQRALARSELEMDLERALWEVESRHQLMEHEQRLYRHFLPALPASPHRHTQGGVSPEPAREVWLFSTGEPRPSSPSLSLGDGPASEPAGGPPGAAVTEPEPAAAGSANTTIATATAAATAPITGCTDLFTQIERRLQTEFHAMVQALSVRWTERSLQELRRCRPGQQQSDQDELLLDQERDQLQLKVRELQTWLEDTYQSQLQLLDQRLHAQKNDILKAEADLLEKARTLSEDPHVINQVLRGDNDQLRLKLRELEHQQAALLEQVAAHEQELDGLREYFQEKVKFTEKMYSDEIRRLIQQQAQTEAGAMQLLAAADGLDEPADLSGSFTDVGRQDGDDSVGPSILRLRVEFERRLAALRQQLEHKVASRSRDIRTELERKHRQEITELERKHLTKLAQTVERYKKEMEACRREADKQLAEVKSQLMEQHQDEVQRITQKQRQQQKSEATSAGGGGHGDGAGDGYPVAAETEDDRRQVLLAELENLSFEMKKQNESEQAAFLEQQRLSLERFARQQERAVRQLEAREQVARDEAAQAERELVALRAQSAEAEICRDQAAARWQLELATGYETQIKAVLVGVTLDEETAISLAQLRTTLQRDSGAALAELEAAHQAALRAMEARHERQQRELRLQLEAAARRERHLQETLTEELASLQERLGAELSDRSHAGDGLSLEVDGLRLHVRQLEQARQRLDDPSWTAEQGGTVEVAREELQMLHKEREEQTEQLQQLGGLVRTLCQYYHTAERLYRPPPPPGHGADPEAEATDRMVLEALAPDEGVALWAERGRQLPRVQLRVREATARLQAAAGAGSTVPADQALTERAERAERRAAELERRVDGLVAELAAARQQVALLTEREEQAEEREAVGESRPLGQPAPKQCQSPEVTLQCIREAAEVLLTTPADPGDSGLLLNRVHQLEALLSELTVQSDQMVADCNREVDDVKQQMAAADKQLRAARSFLDELTAEREAERDEFSREQARLTELAAARERERDEQALRRRQLEGVELQNTELLASGHEGELERARLREELKAAVDKINDLRDMVWSLESQLDQLAAAEDGGDVARLKAELLKQTANSQQLQTQLSSCTCGGAGRSRRPRQSGGGVPPAPTAALDVTANSDETTLSVCPSLLQELRDEILRMETDLDQRVETLENSVSSAGETISPAGSRQDLTKRPAGDDLGRLRHKLDRLVSVEETALARIRQLETELTGSRASQQDLLVEREQLQQQLTEQLLQLSALRARLQQSRLAAEVGTEPPDQSRARVTYLQAELDAAAKLMKSKEKQLADLTCQLDETRRRLIVRESELARLERERARTETPHSSPAGSPRDAAELRALRTRHRALQLQHQELLAQLRENNLPEFVERLLSDKNQQIDDLEQSVRGLTQQSMRSSSAGDSWPGRLAVVSGESGQPSPEVLRRAATSTLSDPADLSRPDISIVQQKEDQDSPPSVPRPVSPPASEHSWDSAPTEAAGSQLGATSASSASAAGSSASRDSIQNLKAALARKKQLLNARKQQLEERTRGEEQQDLATADRQQEPEQQLPQQSAEEIAPNVEGVARIQQHLVQFRSRLDVLNPILARLDQDYSSTVDSISARKAGTSETEIRLMAEVAEMRRIIEQQDSERLQLERNIQQLEEQGVPEHDVNRRQLDERLLVTLRDMEINKLDACSRMHEAAALMARAQRHSERELQSRLNSAEQNCQAKDTELRELQSRLDSAEQNCHVKDAELRELQSRLDSSEQNCHVKDAELRELQSRLESAEQSVQEKETENGQLRDGLQRCQEADQAREALDRQQTARLQSAQKEAKKKDGHVQKAKARLRAAEEEAKKKDSHARAVTERLRKAEEEAATRESHVQELMASIGSLQQSVENRESQVQELMGQISSLEADVRRSGGRAAELEAQVAELTSRLETIPSAGRTSGHPEHATDSRQSYRRRGSGPTRPEKVDRTGTGGTGRSWAASSGLECGISAERPEPEISRRSASQLELGSSVADVSAGSCQPNSDSSLTPTGPPERDPGPGLMTTVPSEWRERCVALERRCRQLTASRRQEERRRRQLETRLTALLDPAAQEQQQQEQEQEPAGRLQTLLDKLHQQGVEVLTLSELRFVRSHSAAAGTRCPDTSARSDGGGSGQSSEHDLRQKVELLEWLLQEERSLVDSLQGWLQAEHQAKLRLISSRLQAESLPSDAALPAEQQQQCLTADTAMPTPVPAPTPAAAELPPLEELQVPPCLPVPVRHRVDGSGDGSPLQLPDSEQLQLRRQLSTEQLQRRRLLAELEAERSRAAQQQLQLERERRAALKHREVAADLHRQLSSATTELESLRAELSERTAELEALRAARAGGGGGGGQRQMAGLADMNAEVDRLRARISELEHQLGQRGDAPSESADREPWLSQLEQERAAWSQERQRLQQMIARLDGEQKLRRLAQSGDGDDARLQYAYGRFLRAESYRRALCWQKRYLMVLLGGYQETEVMTLQRMRQLTGGAFCGDGRRFLSPAAKFRSAAWVLIAISRMDFMVNRWRSGRRVAGALTTPEPPPPAGRPLSSASLVSATSCDAPGELDRLRRIVNDCPGSVPDLHIDTRSVASVSDVCTEDLEPYLVRFDALLDRQGLPPQPGSSRPDGAR